MTAARGISSAFPWRALAKIVPLIYYIIPFVNSLFIFMPHTIWIGLHVRGAILKTLPRREHGDDSSGGRKGWSHSFRIIL